MGKRLYRVWEFLAKRWVLVAVILVVSGAVVAGLIAAGQSVWFDENYSIVLARSGWGEMWNLTGVDAHPPLYYALLKIWDVLSPILGGDFWLRCFSILCAGAAGFLAIWFIRRRFSAKTAILAAPFIVFAPFLLRYGFEIRMYALASLITIASTFVLFEVLERKKKGWWVFYGVLVAAGMWTLHFMIFVFLAHLIWLLKNHRGKEKFFRLPYVRSYLLAVVLYLPFLPFAVYQLTHSAAAGIGTNMGATEALRAMSFNLVYEPEFWLNGVSGVLVLAGVVVIARAVILAWRESEKRERQTIGLLLLIFLLPILVLMPLSLFGVRIFVERYQAPYVICFYILMGVSLAMMVLKEKKWAKVSYLLILGTLIYGVFSLARYGNYNFQRMEENRFKEVAADIGGCSEDKAIVVDDILVYFEIAHYAPNCESLYFYSKDDIGLHGGYAPVAYSPQRILFNVESEELVVVRIKGKEEYETPVWYEEGRRITEYDVIDVLFYNKV
jgi:uncharacterized membrane protein